MRFVLISVIFFLFTLTCYSQRFLDSYKKYRLEKVSTVSNPKAKRKLKAYIKSHILELDTIFNSYKARAKFDFDRADTLFLIYQSAVESPFMSDIIIWSGKDTLSYSQELEFIRPFKNKRIVVYKPFLYSLGKIPGYKEVTERDSLVTLTAKMDFETILHLGDNQNILDGSYTTIYIAIKSAGKYKIKSCSPPKFYINTINRVE